MGGENGKDTTYYECRYLDHIGEWMAVIGRECKFTRLEMLETYLLEARRRNACGSWGEKTDGAAVERYCRELIEKERRKVGRLGKDKVSKG